MIEAGDLAWRLAVVGWERGEEEEADGEEHGGDRAGDCGDDRCVGNRCCCMRLWVCCRLGYGVAPVEEPNDVDLLYALDQTGLVRRVGESASVVREE